MCDVTGENVSGTGSNLENESPRWAALRSHYVAGGIRAIDIASSKRKSTQLPPPKQAALLLFLSIPYSDNQEEGSERSEKGQGDMMRPSQPCIPRDGIAILGFSSVN